MKKVIILTLAGLFSLNLSAQITKKEKREAARRAEKERVLEMANNREFVLEAHLYANRYQYQRPLPTNNFFAVSGDKVLIQTADINRIGQNGLGGITAEGRILKYEVSEGGKNNPVRVMIDFSNGYLGMGTLSFSLSGEDHATVQLTDNRGNRNSWSGDLKAIDEHSGYTGMTLN